MNETVVVGPLATYEARVHQFGASRDRHAAAAARLMHARIVSFIAVIAASLGVERRPGPLTIAALVAAIAAFIAFVILHRRERAREMWDAARIRLNEAGSHRLRREWDALPARLPSVDVSAHPYAADLDLFGRASLTQVLGPVSSARGTVALDAMLLSPVPAAEIAARQQAVRELAPELDFREHLAIHAERTAEARATDVERFLHWAEGPGWLRAQPLVVALSWLLPIATWSLMLAELLGVIEPSLWLLPMLVSLGVYLTSGVRARRTFDQAFGREAIFLHYPALLAHIARASFQDPLLESLRRRLLHEGEPADHQLERLRRLMHLADIRTSTMHLPIFLLTLWDVHVLHALEGWQRAAGASARDWLAAAGELEALASLATLAHDEPDWTFARVDAEADILTAEAMGHPLLRDDARVTNDVVLGPPGTFLFVTGSNMSGKSTLLRAIGTNVVLAQAGAPSCARRLSMPPLRIGTSIRVQDSLARGVSYFMAELERLKQVVDTAHAAREEGTVLLFLLDEILHGTNTAERRIAARRVIRHLLGTRSIGAVTSHDLELAEDPVLAPAAQLVHFREHFTHHDAGSSLAFDYILNPGLATSTNALELMKLVGLPTD